MSNAMLTLTRILIFYAFVCLTFQQKCFKMKLLSVKSTDTKFYRTSVKINPNNTVDSITEVLKDIPEPIWTFRLKQTGDSYSKTHFEAALKACEMKKFMKRVRFFREMTSTFFTPEKGNMTLKCPMKVGTYVMYNLFIPPESSFMRFYYIPNTILTLRGAVGEKKANKKLEELTTYEFKGTILRTC